MRSRQSWRHYYLVRADSGASVANDYRTSCSDGTGGARFAMSGVGWIQGSADLRYGINTSFNVAAWLHTWSSALDHGGTHQVVTEATGDVTVTFNNLSGSLLGQASCSGGYLRLDDRYMQNPADGALAAETAHVAMHEFGHVLGLGHAGSGASHDSLVPLMATCLTQTTRRSTTTMSSDDRASWHLQNDGLTNFSGVLSNPGFEMGLFAWGASPGMTAWSTTSSPPHGTQRASIIGATVSERLDTVVTLSGPGGNGLNLDILAREAASGVSGNLYIDVYWREVTYGSPGTCSYPSGRNENSASVAGSWTHLGTKVKALTTTWENVDWGPTITPTQSGYLMARVRSSALLNGNPASIHLDTFHMEVS